MDNEAQHTVDAAASDAAEPTPPPEGDAALVPAPPRRPGWLSRLFHPSPSGRDARRGGPPVGSREVLDLLHSVSNHLDRQAEVQARLLRALDRFPQALDGLQQVGRAAEEQTEVLRLVRRQLESNAEHEQQLADGMGRFNKTLGVMDETSRASARAVNDLVERARESEESLQDMLDRSERRLGVALVVLGGLTVLVIGAALFLGLRDRSGAALPPAPAADAAAPAPDAEPAENDVLDRPGMASLPVVEEAAEAERPEPPAGEVPEPAEEADQDPGYAPGAEDAAPETPAAAEEGDPPAAEDGAEDGAEPAAGTADQDGADAGGEPEAP